MYLILELCDRDFRTYLEEKKKRSRGLEEYEVKYWMQQITDGLKYLSSRSFAHRDLKPGNLLLKKIPKQKSSNGKEPEFKQYVIKLADLGFVRQIQIQSPAETICGSWTYMAPEIIKGMPYDMKADLWSLGIIMYRMICGTSPYKKQYSNGNTKILKEISQLNVKKSLENLNLKISGTLQDGETIIYMLDDCVDLLSRLLVEDPEKRISFEDLFNHKFLRYT